jgi:amino acid transporter
MQQSSPIQLTEKLQEPAGLKRVIGVSGLALTIVNFVIGSAIFVLPGIVGVQLGGYAIFGYLFGGLMIISIMLCYAETGSKIVASGGTYAYIKAAFGEFPAYVANWLFIVAVSILSDAAIISLFCDSLGILFPVFTNFWIRSLLLLGSISFMAAINIVGAKQSIAFIKTVTVIKLIPLVGIIIFGFSHVKAGAFHFEHLPRLKTFGSVMLVLFFAFPGFESALSTSGEIKNAHRTVPKAIILSAIFIVSFYLLIQFVTQGVLGNEMEAAKNAPLAAVAQKIIGPAGEKILLITAAISCFGSVFADILNGPRLLFAGAKDNLFPKFLARTHAKFATPFPAIIIYASLIFIIAIGGGFQQLAILATAAILLLYLGVVLATLKLRHRKIDVVEKTFRMPGGMIFPGIAIVSICILLLNLKSLEIISAIIFVAIVSIIYYISKQVKKSSRLKAEQLNVIAESELINNFTNKE